MRYEYRVTKYNPARRDVDGAYRADEWIGFTDVGRRFGGRLLTMSEYLRVERLHLSALELFLKEAMISSLNLRDLETDGLRGASAKIWRTKKTLRGAEITRFATLALRNRIWGRLESPRRAFVHFGYDYYMYIGLSRETPNAIEAVRASGLYVAPFASPYKRAA